MRKRSFRGKPKRTTFWKMFAKAMILPIIIIIAVSYYSFILIRFNVGNEVSASISKFHANYINRTLNTGLNKKLPDQAYISMFGNVYPELIGGYLDPITWVEPESKAITFTFDKDGNIIDSNKAKIAMAVRMSEDPRSTVWYYCDPGEYSIPELDKFYNDILSEQKDIHINNVIDITSFYVNEADNKMIPHKIKVTKTKSDYGFMDYGFWNESQLFPYTNEKLDEYEVTINADVEGYKLTEIHSRNTEDNIYPCGSIQGVFGCDAEQFDEMFAECSGEMRYFLEGSASGGVYGHSDPYMKVIGSAEIQRLYSDNEKVGICSYVISDVSKLHSWRRLIFMMSLLFAFMTLIVFLICWRRNVKNKAQYAFEDYQRALTNNLAHDLKTPLAVIGGYAENLMEMHRESSDEKELSYLSSIMDNVAYTDDIIRKTLKLSETEQKKKLNKTKVDIKALAEKCAEKYKDAIDERGIELEIVGSGEVTADEDSLSLAFDNLISNAVKYTRNDGSIKITASKKGFAVENDTAENVDTKELKMPFVKGDKARSDKSSSGLGLSIAEAAAIQNGFKLKISCKDKKFTARIDM